MRLYSQILISHRIKWENEKSINGIALCSEIRLGSVESQMGGVFIYLFESPF